MWTGEFAYSAVKTVGTDALYSAEGIGHVILINSYSIAYLILYYLVLYLTQGTHYKNL
mgnify:CR=1 FL=1